MRFPNQVVHPFRSAFFNNPVFGSIMALPTLNIGKRLPCSNPDFLSDFVGHHIPLLEVVPLFSTGFRQCPPRATWRRRPSRGLVEEDHSSTMIPALRAASR